VACAVALAVLALEGAGDVAGTVGVRVAAVGVLALVTAIVQGWPRLVATSLVLLGSAYALHLSVDDVSLDARAPLFAAGLLLTAELAFWSLEERDHVRGEPGDGFRRLGFVALLGLAALAVAATVLAAVDVARTGGLAVDLLGAGAAAAALLIVVLIARERPTA
jgi:hypothetical protein